MQQFFLIIDSSYLGVNGFVRSRSYTLRLHIPNDPGHFSEWQTTRPPNSREWSTILQADLMEDMRTKPSWWQWWLLLKGFERLQRICFVWEPQQYLASVFLQHRACTPDERLPIPRSSATAARASFEDNLAPNIPEGGCEGVAPRSSNVKSICEGFYGMNDDWRIWAHKNSLSGELRSDRENKGAHSSRASNPLNALRLSQRLRYKHSLLSYPPLLTAKALIHHSFVCMIR